MSHMSVSKIRIMNPNQELLKQVIEHMAKEMGGVMVSTIGTMEGKSQTGFLAAFTTERMKRGVGFRVMDGQVCVFGDFWGLSNERKKLEDELVKNYTATAIAVSMRKMGYQVEVQVMPEQVILVAENSS